MELTKLNHRTTKWKKIQILYQSSNTTFRKNGVGFLENITCSSLLQDYPPSLDRLVVFGLRGKFCKIVLFHCYFLPTRHGNEEISELFDNILTTMDDKSKRYYFLLLKLTTEPIISRMHWRRCQRQPKCKRQSFNFVLKITYRSIQEKPFRTISPESRRRNQTGFIKTTITSKIFWDFLTFLPSFFSPQVRNLSKISTLSAVIA